MATVDPCNCVGAWTGMHSPSCPRGGGFPTPLREVRPTPPAPAMPDEVRELVKWAKFAQRVVANEEYRILWEQGNGLIAAVEAKYGGSR